MNPCKTGKHFWFEKEDADKCCNGYTRLLVVGSQYEDSKNIQVIAGTLCGRAWKKEVRCLPEGERNGTRI